jgi:predicted nucleic acid-binding protein
MNRVVDASVASKWFFPEPDSDAADALLDSRTPLFAPELIVAEVCNVAWKRLRAGEATPEQAAAAADSIGEMIDELVPMAALARPSLEIARALKHPVYDCFYLALADRLDTHVVTGDDVLVQRTEGTRWARRVRRLAPGARRR